MREGLLVTQKPHQVCAGLPMRYAVGLLFLLVFCVKSGVRPLLSFYHSMVKFLHPLCNVGKHTIFGRVQSGMGIVQRIGLVNTGNDDR